jgi:CHAT domain-containing protein
MITAVLPSFLIACALTKYALASRFVKALGAHDITALRSLGADSLSFPVSDTLGRFGRITIRSWTVDQHDGITRIRIDGIGIAVNARHDVKPIPATWILRDGTVTTEDHFLAQSIIAAHDDAARDAMVTAHPEYGPHDLMLAVLDELEESHDPDFARTDAMTWVITRAEDRSDWAVASRALSEPVRREPFPEAARRSQGALAIALRTNDCDVVAAALFRAGNSSNVGTNGDGNGLLRQSASMADTLDDGRIALKALHNYASYSVWNGNLRRGFTAAELLEKKSRQFGWREGENMAHLTMADVDAIISDNEAALALRRQALAGLDALGNGEFATWAAADVAQEEMHLGRRNAALRDMNAALARATAGFRNRELLVDLLAEMYVKNGRIREAERVLRGQPETHHIVRAEILAAQHRYAEELTASRLAAGGCSPEEDACWQGRMLAGRALLHLGRRNEAIASLQAAIDTIEHRRAQMDTSELRRERFFEERLEPYRDLLDLYVHAGRTSDALKIAETVKARVLLDTLSLGRSDIRAALTAAEEERRRGLDARIEQLNRRHIFGGELDEARKALEAFDEEMALRHPVGRGLQSSEVSQDLAAVVRARDVAAIEYAVLPRSVIAFVVVRDGHGSVAIHATRIVVTSAEIGRRAGALHRAIAERSLACEAQLATLHDLLLAPLRQWIGGKKLLVVVPDGALWQVPFQALASRGGEPLIAQTALAYAPSLAALTVSRTHGDESRRTLLAMGDASIGSEARAQLRSFDRDLPLGRLPDAADEVRAIAAEYGAEQSDVFVHDAATETMLKASAGRYRIIHLATHGIADSRWPMFSSLVLAPTTQDDGLIEAREVADLHLDADLVVLSACDTARGVIRSGEGVVGLSWAFLLAGCPRTVVSQWSADSKATSLLMIEFHRQLVRGATAAEALQRAELALMHSGRWAHPYYWADFIVLGNP